MVIASCKGTGCDLPGDTGQGQAKVFPPQDTSGVTAQELGLILRTGTGIPSQGHGRGSLRLAGAMREESPPEAQAEK